MYKQVLVPLGGSDAELVLRQASVPLLLVRERPLRR